MMFTVVVPVGNALWKNSQAPTLPLGSVVVSPPAAGMLTWMSAGKPPVSTRASIAVVHGFPTVAAPVRMPCARRAPNLTPAPEATAPATPWADARRSSSCISKNLGSATAARMPRMVITTTSSMIVNPATFLIVIPCLARILHIPHADTITYPHVGKSVYVPGVGKARADHRLAQLAQALVLARRRVGQRHAKAQALQRVGRRAQVARAAGDVDQVARLAVVIPAAPRQRLGLGRVQRAQVVFRRARQEVDRVGADLLLDGAAAPADHQRGELHGERDVDRGEVLLHGGALAELLIAHQPLERHAEQQRHDAHHHHQLDQREAARLQRRRATRDRSHIGRNTPRARISTMTPRNTMRIGSICAARVLIS